MTLNKIGDSTHKNYYKIVGKHLLFVKKKKRQSFAAKLRKKCLILIILKNIINLI